MKRKDSIFIRILDKYYGLRFARDLLLKINCRQKLTFSLFSDFFAITQKDFIWHKDLVPKRRAKKYLHKCFPLFWIWIFRVNIYTGLFKNTI